VRFDELDPSEHIERSTEVIESALLVKTGENLETLFINYI